MKMKKEDKGEEEPVENKGKMLVDATVAEQAIRYPTDLSLLNEAREISEQLIDDLYKQSGYPKKPRTYRRVARKNYLNLAKKKKPGKKIQGADFGSNYSTSEEITIY
nr:hypothetical protein [Candidatus Electrothrix aestuarii]